MSIVVACKLPQGLEITHNNRSILLRGQNVGFDADNPTVMGKFRGDANGFGLTTLEGPDADVFQEWVDEVTYKKDASGKAAKANGKLATPFLALENGSIQVFKSRADAEAETNMLGDSVTTGFEGIDPDKDLPKNLSTDTDAMKAKK